MYTLLNPTFIQQNWGMQGFTYFSYFCSKTRIVGTRKKRLGEAVLTCTHNLCFEQKKYHRFSAENFQFLTLKKLCLLHGQVFVM